MLPRVVARNQTERSRACHDVIARFLDSGLDAAYVELPGWDSQTLYRGLWNACRNRAYRGLVSARKVDGRAILQRQRG